MRRPGMILGATEETSMKKQMKKLVLSKETVRSLEVSTLPKVVAGISVEVPFCFPGESNGTLCTNCDC
jgi:hypothetical protein